MTARRERDAARTDAQQAREEADSLRQQQTETREVLAFFPEYYDRMKERTRRARELEQAYRDGDRYGCDLDGGRVSYRDLLDEYREVCQREKLPHDPDMWEHLDRLIERERDDLEWER